MKEHLKSAAYTFLTTFVIAIWPALETTNWESATWKTTALALLFVGVRAGLKAVGLLLGAKE